MDKIVANQIFSILDCINDANDTHDLVPQSFIKSELPTNILLTNTSLTKIKVI